MSVLVRTDGDPAAVLPSIRRAIHEAGGDVPVFGASTVIDRIAESMKPRRLALMAAFAALALVIGAAALGACYLPARRATAIEPVAALRDDAEG